MPAPQLRLHRRAARHVGRGAHHVLRWIGGLAGVAILLALVGIWRLMQGPIELDWLAPYAEAGFARSGIGLKVSVSGVRLGLDHTTHHLDLRAENVRLALPTGEPLANFPEMATSFSLPALLAGRLAPTQVVIERPVLHLLRDADGYITARIASEDQSAPTEFGPPVLEQLVGPPQRDAPLGLLRRVRISGATVIVDDRRSGQSWRADRVDLAVERDRDGISGDISLAVPIGNGIPEFRASYRYARDTHLLDVDMSIDAVRPADIPPLLPELAQLQHIDAPVSGSLHARFDLAAYRPQGSRLDLALGKGQLHSSWLPAGSTAVEGGELHAVYAPEASELRIEKAALDLGGGAVFAVDGTLAGVTPELFDAPPDARPPGHVKGNLTAALKHVPIDRLGALWPAGFSAGGRRWVLANVHEGMLDEASTQLDLDLDPLAHTANVLNAHGAMQYHDLTINYFNGLPPVRKVAGTAVFTDKHLDFMPGGGVLKGLKLISGVVRLSELGERTEWLTIDMAVAGSMQDTLEIIDSKPLRYAHEVGLDPARVGGRAETQLHFKLPLLADVKMDAIEYGAKATITGAAIAKAMLDRDISDGNLGLDITRTGAHAQGTVKFDGIPAKIDANVAFHPKSGPRVVYKVGLTLDSAAQRRLELDIAPDRLSGPIAVDVTYNAASATGGEATALLDLRGATLNIAEAGWKKPADQPGTAKIVLDLENERIAQIRQIDVKAPGLDGHFAAFLDAERKHIARVDIRRLIVGDSDVLGTVARGPGGGWRADIHAFRADARHMIKDATTGAPAPASPPLALNARIDRLVFGPQRELHQVTADMSRTAGSWNAGRIEGRFASGHRLSLNFGEGGGHALAFRTDDLGATLQLLDIADGVTGGKLTIDGELSETAGKRTLRAHVEGQNYTLVRAPTMARILALPSLTGFASMLSGSGLPFSRVSGDLVYSGSRLTLEQMLAFGEAVGVTANGWIDLDRDWLELQGTVAPAYALNSLLGNVPIIGQILGGGSQGLFAANYRLSGPEADPSVTVNPLSALAPGILRHIFNPIVGLPPPPQHRAAQ